MWTTKHIVQSFSGWIEKIFITRKMPLLCFFYFFSFLRQSVLKRFRFNYCLNRKVISYHDLLLLKRSLISKQHFSSKSMTLLLFYLIPYLFYWVVKLNKVKLKLNPVGLWREFWTPRSQSKITMCNPIYYNHQNSDNFEVFAIGSWFFSHWETLR